MHHVSLISLCATFEWPNQFQNNFEKCEVTFFGQTQGEDEEVAFLAYFALFLMVEVVLQYVLCFSLLYKFRLTPLECTFLHLSKVELKISATFNVLITKNSGRTGVLEVAKNLSANFQNSTSDCSKVKIHFVPTIYVSGVYKQLFVFLFFTL